MQTPLVHEVRQRLVPHVIALAGFSLVSNLLLLVAPLYMLQVYDRVLGSGSRDTLVWLTVLAVFLLGIYGVAESGRRRVCALAGDDIERMLAPRVFCQFERSTGSSPTLSRDLGALAKIQSTLQSGSVLPFIDLPFTPIFLAVLFFIHPFLGLLGLAGGVLVFAVAVAAEMTTRQTGQVSQAALRDAYDFAGGLERQRSAMAAMGLVSASFRVWRNRQGQARALAMQAARSDGVFSSLSKSARQVLQILVLGGGAALALMQEISPGAIVASSIILARTLGPIDQIVGGWRNSVQAWMAWRQLENSLSGTGAVEDYTPLPRPAPELSLERLSIVVPGADAPLIHPFSWSVKGGQVVAIVGANGAGKTALLQTVSGAWPPGSGIARLGGRDLHRWNAADRGRFEGYVPQDVELLPASVRDNIARLGEEGAEAVIAAAEASGAHSTILSLPEGYDTRVGPGGLHLSAGQRQLIGLARALFDRPVLLLLDEPTANLDTSAAGRVIDTLEKAAGQGTIVLAATHDRRLIERASSVLYLRNGEAMAASSRQFLDLAAAAGERTVTAGAKTA
ncbi:MAG: ATP-binding cassette domain-containing protein [Pseudomonadota bacterium]|nr:ATP-binding cassette domain-containing protein [Pseudomonadota bacterium]